jgi:hypothetical protein
VKVTANPPTAYDFVKHNYCTTAKQIETRQPGLPTWSIKKHRKYLSKAVVSNDAIKKISVSLISALLFLIPPP